MIIKTNRSSRTRRYGRLTDIHQTIILGKILLECLHEGVETVFGWRVP